MGGVGGVGGVGVVGVVVVLAPARVVSVVLAAGFHGVEGAIGVGARAHAGGVAVAATAALVDLQPLLGVLQLPRQVLRVRHKQSGS